MMPIPLDLTQAIRSLRSWRFSAAVAIVTLALGIGAATTMFTLVRVSLSSTVPDVDDMPALARVVASSRAMGVERSQLTLKDAEVVGQAASFESAGAYASGSTIEAALGTERASVSVEEVSAGLFDAWRVRPELGRLFLRSDFHERAPVAVVSDRVWRTRFAGRALADATVTLDGTPRTIVGVLPASGNFSFIGLSGDVWLPMLDAPERRVSILARLKRGFTWNAAASELDALGRPRNQNGLWTWTAIPLKDDVNRRAGGDYGLMFGPALVVLLIGCTNVACMLLARGVERDTELSVKSALGASRWQIARQLFWENFLLSLAGGALGVAVAYALIRLISAAIAQFRPEAEWAVPSSDLLLLIAVGFSVGACFLFGTLPVLRLSRRDIVASLKGSPAPAIARFVGYRGRDLVVFAEVGGAVALILTTALFTRLLTELRHTVPLFPAEHVIAVDTTKSNAAAAAARLAHMPGVSGVSIADDLPGNHSARGSDLFPGGRVALLRGENGRSIRAAQVAVDDVFFRTLGIPMLRGRSFDSVERTGRSNVVVVSETAAATLWPNEEAVGQRVTISASADTYTVVGVSRDALDARGMIRAGLMVPDVFVPIDSSRAAEVLLFVRAAADARALVRPISLAARPDASGRALNAYVLGTTLVHEDSVFVIRVFGGFALLALLLAGTGIFGVISQSVAQRTTEFGVRMAIGATPGQVLRMVLAREVKLIGAAVGVAVVGTVLVTHAALPEMLALTGTDVRMWLIVSTLCGGVAGAGVAFATWRIVRLDPWTVLRST